MSDTPPQPPPKETESIFGNLAVHPMLARFPRMSDEEFSALLLDIKKNGLMLPVVKTENGVLVDGISRYLACKQAGVEVIYRTLPADWTEKQIVDYIIRVNVARRHLTTTQRAVIGLEWGDEYGAIELRLAGEPNLKPINLIARRFAISARVILYAKKVRGDGNERDRAYRDHLWERMRDNFISVHGALAKLHPQGETIVHATAVGIETHTDTNNGPETESVDDEPDGDQPEAENDDDDDDESVGDGVTPVRRSAKVQPIPSQFLWKESDTKERHPSKSLDSHNFCLTAQHHHEYWEEHSQFVDRYIMGMNKNQIADTASHIKFTLPFQRKTLRLLLLAMAKAPK